MAVETKGLSVNAACLELQHKAVVQERVSGSHKFKRLLAAVAAQQYGNVAYCCARWV